MKARIAAAAKAELQEGYWATTDPVAVTIFYFPSANMQGDINNIVKLILDSLIHVIYMSDQQVERLLVQKFEPGRLSRFSNPSPCRSEEHTSELQSHSDLVCRLLLEKKKK